MNASLHVKDALSLWGGQLSRSASRDDDAFGTTDVTESIAVLVLLHLAYEFGPWA
jgi:hypothetical protein